MRAVGTLAFAVVVLAGAAMPAPALAEPTRTARTEATRLKREADALMDQDRYVDALALYGRAYELSGDPALLYNQGRALEATGDYPEALDKLEKFDREASASLRAKVPGLRDLLNDLRGRIATIVVTTNVGGARLLVREKAVGTIQKETRLRTRAGAAVIEVLAEGYSAYKKELDLAGGTTTKIDAVLVAKKVDALLVVRTHPNADIAIDGKAIGRAPLEFRVPPGQHILYAEAEGRVAQKVPMTLNLGDRREVDLDLKPTPSITSRWWFWTGLVVVVAGGVATAVALTTERDATPGTFGGGIVTGP